MKEEYEAIFKKDCKLLFKGHSFDKKNFVVRTHHAPFNLVYMGNIGQGRWKTLAELAKSIKKVNDSFGKQIFILNVYTLSPKNQEITKKINIKDAARLNDAVPNDKVQVIMDNADILVHAEPFKKSDYQFYRASFSTKLVDYFYAAKCILAIGGMTASTDYLKRNDAAICVTEREKITDTLTMIANNPQILTDYSERSWHCGVQNHQIKDIQDKMYNDFKKLINI